MKMIRHNNKGQFVIIAALLIAIMIISIGALMHTAVTYYKHEPWEEYLTLIGNIELNSRQLVELSLANYTNSNPKNPSILEDNLRKWQTNLTAIYPGREAYLNYTLANQAYNVDGITINYESGLAYIWEKQTSLSAANVTFTLNIASIGLTGYKFTVTTLVKLKILSPPAGDVINVTVTLEDGMPITDLTKDNFQVDNADVVSVSSTYDPTYQIVYTIRCANPISTPVTVKLWDLRGIQVTAKYPSS
jgi:hypothetical protein